MAKSKFFLLFSLIFLGANLFLLLFDFIWPANVLYIWLFFVLTLILSIWRRYFFLLLVILAAFLRIYYFIQPEILAQQFVYEQKYTFSAFVLDADKRLDGWQLLVKSPDLKLPGKIIVYAPLYPDYQVGDSLGLSCRLFKPEKIDSGSGRQFDYPKYLAKDNILATCPATSIKYLGHQARPLDFLSKSKQYFLDNLDKNISDPAAAFAKAIILDSRQEMPKYLTPLFSHTGLTHVISISGLHMVVIIWFFHWLLQILGLKRQHIFWVLAAVLFLYLYLLGFISPALRSTAMILLVLLGPSLGRPALSVYSLLFLVDVMVLVNPYILLYDIGWQLSFSATLGLIWYVPLFKNMLAKLPNPFAWQEVLAVTLAAQVFTWPLVLYYFHIFSLVSPLANFLVLPLFPPILILSLMVAIFGGQFGQILGWPLGLLIKLMFWLIKNLGGGSWSYLTIDNFSLPIFLSSLILMIVITLIIKPYERSTD
ncbi:MAG: ComEC/Rec2 family competence protein [Patescibacteria group bacterium]